MSDPIIFRTSTIRSAVTEFVDSVLLKHRHYPAKEDALQTFTECRERMQLLGASEKSLDDFESYTKKLLLGIYEKDADKLTAFSNHFVREILFDQFDKAQAAGRPLHVIGD